MSAVFKIEPARQAWLELPGGQLFFLRDRITIGRLPGNDLVLPDDALSRQHALITLSPAGYVLTDMQSRNGTYVGGKLLARPVTLRDGDRFRLGTLELRFRCMRRIHLPEPGTGDGDTTQALPKFETCECWLAVVAVENYPTVVAESGSEKSLQQLQTWITGVRPLLEQHFAQIAYYAGDTILAYWPCASTKPSDVLAALRAFETWRARSPLPFRLVIHHGTSLISAGANGDELGGRDVSSVCRMEKIAKELGTQAMLSTMAVRTLGVEERCEPCGRSTIDGTATVSTFYGPPGGPRARTELTAVEAGAGESMSDSGKAVFLSYASQDAAAARRICEALRAANVEVWFDQSELRGGDAWDHKIRRQIKACALFVPIISANTQARREGYFRIEWKLAAQRTHAIADGVPFLLPVVIDATPEPAALVPAEFRDVQWTRLNRADDTAAFAQRVRDLVDPPSSGESEETRPPMPGWNAP
jgi:class 3 adenylate cyclase